MSKWLTDQSFTGRGIENIQHLPAKLIKSCTFFKSFEPTKYTIKSDATAQLYADYAIGSRFATFTASRGATTPATYIDSDGIVQLTTTSNIPRIAGGFYDTTGFHTVDSNGKSVKGLMIEAAGTNLLIRTDGTNSSGGLWLSWLLLGIPTGTPVYTQVVASSITNIVSSNLQRFQYTGIAGDANLAVGLYQIGTAGSVSPGNVVTFSLWLKSQSGFSGVTGMNIIISWRNSSGGLISETQSSLFTPTSTLVRYSITGTAPALTDKVNVKIQTNATIDNGDNVDFEFWGPQIEKNPYATSFIPTTTAALTRNAEVLKYLIANNRTAAQETIVIKFTPTGNFANDGAYRNLLSNDGDNRVVRKEQVGTLLVFSPNSTDEISAQSISTTTPLTTLSYSFGFICYQPNALKTYLAGVLENSEAISWSVPGWTTYFYIGSSVSGDAQLNGVISSVVFFSRVLSLSELGAVTNIMNGE